MESNRTAKALDAETLAASVSRAMRATKESEGADGSRQLPRDTLREAGSVEQVIEDAYNRCVFEHAMGTKKLIRAKDFREAVGKWGVSLQARTAAFKLRFMMDTIASGGKSGINLIIMPFMMKNIPAKEECDAWHRMWDSDAPFTNIVAETFDPAEFMWDIKPTIIHTTSPKQPIMFAAAVALKVRDTAKEGEAKEEDPKAMD